MLKVERNWVKKWQPTYFFQVPGHAVMTSGSATPSEVSMYKQLLNTAQVTFRNIDVLFHKMHFQKKANELQN